MLTERQHSCHRVLSSPPAEQPPSEEAALPEVAVPQRVVPAVPGAGEGGHLAGQAAKDAGGEAGAVAHAEGGQGVLEHTRAIRKVEDRLLFRMVYIFIQYRTSSFHSLIRRLCNSNNSSISNNNSNSSNNKNKNNCCPYNGSSRGGGGSSRKNNRNSSTVTVASVTEQLQLLETVILPISWSSLNTNRGSSSSYTLSAS